MSPKTILSREGYIINKKKFKKEEIDQIKKELTVVPFLPCIFGNQKPEEFPVYKENKKFLSIPKYYGLNKLGKPKLIDENPGETVDLQFKGDLRDYQQEIVNIAMKDMNENDGGCNISWLWERQNCYGTSYCLFVKSKNFGYCTQDFFIRSMEKNELCNLLMLKLELFNKIK